MRAEATRLERRDSGPGAGPGEGDGGGGDADGEVSVAGGRLVGVVMWAAILACEGLCASDCDAYAGPAVAPFSGTTASRSLIMEPRSHRRITRPRAAFLIATVGGLFSAAVLAQGVAPHPPGDPTAPPQQPGAVSSQHQKEHVKKEKQAAREASRQPEAKDKDTSRQAAAPSDTPTKPAPKPR